MYIYVSIQAHARLHVHVCQLRVRTEAQKHRTQSTHARTNHTARRHLQSAATLRTAPRTTPKAAEAVEVSAANFGNAASNDRLHTIFEAELTVGVDLFGLREASDFREEGAVGDRTIFRDVCGRGTTAVTSAAP